MTSNNIAREDILSLRGYKAGDQEADSIRLNANESPYSHWLKKDVPALNRYPEVHPVSLQARIAEVLGVSRDNLLVTRGSSEAIDVLVRAYCRAYRDSVLTTPPTFEMYRFYADVQGVDRIDVPLPPESDFAFDATAVLAACRPETKLIFICSPNNPTGSVVSHDDILRIVEERRNKSIVVVDEAYVEFADQASLANQVQQYENLVVLRTLSKAQALAGARCGVAIAHDATINVMCRVLPPYSFPTPVVQCVLDALTSEQIDASHAFIGNIISERQRLFARLSTMNCVTRVWPSHANFLLVQFANAKQTEQFLHKRKILIRDFSDLPELDNCARITVGSHEENDALLAALTAYEERC